MRVRLFVLVLVLACSGALAATAHATELRATFGGTCTVSGPIQAHAPINAVPRLDARFSYHGTGTCTGSLDGVAIQARSARVDVPRGDIIFDSCFLGPDAGVMAPLEIMVGKWRRARFLLKLDMIRVGSFGPFMLSGPDDGSAFGQAQVRMPSTAAADCADLSGGISEAQLDASFETHSQFVGYSYKLERPKRPKRPKRR